MALPHKYQLPSLITLNYLTAPSSSKEWCPCTPYEQMCARHRTLAILRLLESFCLQ